MGIKSELEAGFDFEIVDEFVDHFSLMVESMEVLILDLSKPDMYHRSVNELFRVFHNIKSASGYLNLTSMFRLASLVEDELEVLRNMDKPINEETITWLFAISDMFAQWQEDFRLDNNLSKVKYSLLKIPDLEK